MSESKFSDPSDYFQENAELLNAIGNRVGTLIEENPQAGASIGFNLKAMSVASIRGTVSVEALMSEDPSMPESEATRLAANYWRDRIEGARNDANITIENAAFGERFTKLREHVDNGMSLEEATQALATFETTKPDTATYSDAQFLDRSENKQVSLSQILLYCGGDIYATSSMVTISDELVMNRFIIARLGDKPILAIHYHDTIKDELEDQIALLDPEDQAAVCSLIIGGDPSSEVNFDEQIEPYMAKYRSSKLAVAFFENVRIRYEQARAANELRDALGADSKPTLQQLIELEGFLTTDE